MNKMSTKLVALGLVLAMLISLAGTCVAESTARPLEGVTLTIWKPLHWIGKVTSDDEVVAWQKVEEILGCDLVFINPPVGTEVESFNLMVAGDTLPDIIMTNWSGDSMLTGGVDRYVDEGILLNVRDLVAEYAPDYVNAIETLVSEDEKKEFYTDSGNMVMFYAISPYEEPCYNGILYRQDWLDELGLENPKTLDEVENVLTQFKEVKGATAPLILPQNGIDGNGGCIMSAWNLGNAFYQEDGVVKYGPSQPAFKEYLAKMNDWYQKGLIDIDFVSRDEDAWKRMMTTGESGAIIHSCDTVGAWMKGITTMLGGHNPTLTADQTIQYRLKTYAARTPFGAAITTACQNVEAALTFLNFGYTEQGMMLYNYGVEGETYNIVDGEVVYTDMMMNNPDYPVLDAILKYKVHIGPFIRYELEGNPTVTDENFVTRNFWNTDSGTDLNMPMVTLTADEGSEYARIMTQVQTYQDAAVVNFITGNKSLDEFDQYLADMEKLGINDVIALEQAALDRYNAR